MEHTVYHIYAKDRCLYHSLKEEQFNKVWSDLQNLVGLMKTDYTLDDLSYERLPAGIGGGGGSVTWQDPPGDPSY